MKILKLLGKKYLTITIFYILVIFSSVAEEPVDIWNLDEEQKDIIINNTTEDERVLENKIYKLQSKKKK